MNLPIYFSSLLIGFFGSAHCLGMCGGISNALSLTTTHNKSNLLLHQLGRLSSYTLLGMLAGSIGGLVHSFAETAFLLRAIAGMLLISIGLHISLRWNGLRWLENLGAVIWKQLAPLAQRLIMRPSKLKQLFLGMLWGWLPCGLVYSTLATAASSGNFLSAALIMLFFGLGTLPVMLTLGFSARQLQTWLRNQQLRLFAGILIILSGIWTIWVAWPTAHHHH